MFSILGTVSIRNGVHTTILEIDNGSVKFSLENENFSGIGFVDLETDTGTIESDVMFEFQVPLNITLDGKNEVAIVNFKIASVESDLTIELKTEFDNKTVEVKHSNMEYALINLQNRLTSGSEIECCLSCRLSSFNPYGNMDVGDLWCLKKYMKEVKIIKSKSDLLDFLPGKKLQKTEEFSYCDQFQKIEDSDFVYSDRQSGKSGK